MQVMGANYNAVVFEVVEAMAMSGCDNPTIVENRSTAFVDPTFRFSSILSGVDLQF